MYDTIKQRMAVFFLINALLVPIVIFSQSSLVSGSFLLMLIVSQAMILGLFTLEEEPDNYAWYCLASVIVCGIFIFFTIFFGRTLQDELVAILLAIAYLISAAVFFASRKLTVSSQPQITSDVEQSGLSDDEIKTFREKDELEDLLETFEESQETGQTHIPEYSNKKSSEDFMIQTPEPKPVIVKIQSGVNDKDYKEENKGYIEFFPEETRENKKEPVFSNTVQIVNMQPQPLDTTSLQEARQKIEQGTEKLSEKIRLIAEKAILEGAEKKLRRIVTESRIKKLEDTDFVYASITGDRYHSIRTCMSLKRVRRKDVVLFENAKDARKKGLKPCGLCNR